MLWSFCGVALYYILSVGIFVIENIIYGYDVWDSTYLHAQTPIIQYFIFALVPPIFIQYIITRTFYIYYANWVRSGMEDSKANIIHIRSNH
jgi:hypothetical protein